MEIQEVQRHWDAFGRTDPLWAILTDPQKRGNRWDREEFFQTGRSQISDLLAQAKSLGIEIRRERALDFGCGVGRLT